MYAAFKYPKHTILCKHRKYLVLRFKSESKFSNRETRLSHFSVGNEYLLHVNIRPTTIYNYFSFYNYIIAAKIPKKG